MINFAPESAGTAVLNRSKDQTKKKTSLTIREVADAAGVSLGSVSRVLNGHATVTAEVRSKVERAIQELGYKPNAMAQSMRSRASRTVGCIIRDINIPGLPSFVRAAQDELLQAGYVLLLANSGGKEERERDLISVMIARQADALLLAQISETDSLLDEIKKLKFPVVLMDRSIPGWADAVTVDHCTSTRQITDLLIQLGHRRIALITGKATFYPARSRIEGLYAAFSAANLPSDLPVVRAGSFDSDFGFEQVSALLESGNRPTAIIAGGLEMLPGVLRAVRGRGLRIPQDISVVGTLNSELAELYVPPITVEDWDYARLGRIAARFALERIREPDESAPKHLMIPSNVIVRGSCGPAPTLR